MHDPGAQGVNADRPQGPARHGPERHHRHP
jgi:hypothetical protein